MFCEKCGKQLPDNSAFCDGCGSPVAAPAAAPAPEAAPDAAPEKPKVEFNKKTLTGIAVIAAAIIVIVLAVVLIANAGGGDAPLLYVTDGELVASTNLKKGEVNVIDDEFVNSDLASYLGEGTAAQEMTYTAHFTADAKKFVFINNMDEEDSTGDLVWIETKLLGKEEAGDKIEKVSSGVVEFSLASEADSLVYQKEDKLYRYDFKEDPVLVSKDVVTFFQTEDGKHISYIKADDEEQELYVYTVKTGESEKIDSGVNSVLDYDYKNAFANMIYTKYDAEDDVYEIYTGGLGKDKEKLLSDVSYAISATSGKGIFYYETDEEWVNTLYWFDIVSGEKTELSDCYGDYAYYSSEHGFIAYYEVDEDYEYTYFIAAVGFDPIEVDETIASGRISSEGDIVYLVEREEDEEEPLGTLVSYTLGKNGLGDRTKIAEDVGIYGLQIVNDNVFYYADFDLDDWVGILYCYNGKDSIKLADEVCPWAVSALDEDRVIFMADEDESHGTLYTFSGKEAVKVSTDVYYGCGGLYNGDIVFLTDYDEEDGGTLNLWNGKDKTKIASDVQAVIIP